MTLQGVVAIISTVLSTFKRRIGFPSETRVKRGERTVLGGKELIEKLGLNNPCHANPAAGFKNCCMPGGCFDGAEHDHYFKE